MSPTNVSDPTDPVQEGWEPSLSLMVDSSPLPSHRLAASSVPESMKLGPQNREKKGDAVLGSQAGR